MHCGPVNTPSVFCKSETRNHHNLDDKMTTDLKASSTGVGNNADGRQLPTDLIEDASSLEGEEQFDRHRLSAGAHGTGHREENATRVLGSTSSEISLSSSKTQDTQAEDVYCPSSNLPRVNCPEKIIICIDLATEVNKVPFLTKEGSKQAPLELIKRALNIFVRTKSFMNPKHQFALVLLQETALWIQDFTSDVTDFVNTLLDMTNETTECEICDLVSLFDVIQEKVSLPEIEDIECLPPPYIVRTLFVYGRSSCIPQLTEDLRHADKMLSLSPYFFFDVFYVHEPPNEDNYCKEIYDVFLHLDVRNTSFIHEVGRDMQQVYQKMAMLTAHPLQRPPQMQCDYNIFTE